MPLHVMHLQRDGVLDPRLGADGAPPPSRWRAVAGALFALKVAAVVAAGVFGALGGVGVVLSPIFHPDDHRIMMFDPDDEW